MFHPVFSFGEEAGKIASNFPGIPVVLLDDVYTFTRDFPLPTKTYRVGLSLLALAVRMDPSFPLSPQARGQLNDGH